jgi:hypothetical protein
MGFDVTVVKELLGHEDIKTTLISAKADKCPLERTTESFGKLAKSGYKNAGGKRKGTPDATNHPQNGCFAALVGATPLGRRKSKTGFSHCEEVNEMPHTRGGFLIRLAQTVMSGNFLHTRGGGRPVPDTPGRMTAKSMGGISGYAGPGDLRVVDQNCRARQSRTPPTDPIPALRSNPARRRQCPDRWQPLEG